MQAQQPGQQVAPELDRLLERRVERLRDLRLQARLLMEADRQVREQHQLGAGLAVALVKCRRVGRERLPQPALAVGRIARSQTLAEGREGGWVDRPVRRRQRQQACKLAADLLEHPEVAASDGVARTIERGSRLQRLRTASQIRSRSARL